MGDLLNRYQEKLEAGLIEPDAAQADIAHLLDELENELENRGG